MNHVKQEDGMGCGVACIAFVLQIPYKDAVGLFIEGDRKAKTVGFYCPEMVKVLKDKGLNYAWRKLNKENMHILDQDLNIVFIKKSPKYKFGHFLSSYKGKWMDPWINFPNGNRESGFRDALPGVPTYVVFKK